MRCCNVTCKIFLVLTAACARALGAVDTVSLTAGVDSAPDPSRAVRIHYTGVLGNASFTNYSEPVYAGQTRWNQAGGTDALGSLLSLMPASFAANGTFSSYCIDVTQNIYIDNAYTYTGLTDALSTDPIISPDSGYAGMGATAAQAVENLFANEYDAVTAGGEAIQYDANPGDTDSSASDQSAAFQIALWDVINGINAAPSNVDVTDSSNGFWVSNFENLPSFNQVAGMADLFADAALGGPDQTFDSMLLVMTSPTLPDQILVGLPSDSQAPIIPAPGTGVLAAPLLGKLGSRRRR